eukprot:maker-scaffold208_size258758-snap-gene-1.28 protein:Tk04199 transcript:maker-scaffold208_size258758-snap-gene-1.28-mRNA-1 annotation:"calpain-b-like isoform x14"
MSNLPYPTNPGQYSFPDEDAPQGYPDQSHNMNNPYPMYPGGPEDVPYVPSINPNSGYSNTYPSQPASGYPPSSYPGQASGGYPPSTSDYPPQFAGGYPPSDPTYPPHSVGGYPPSSENYPPQPMGGYPPSQTDYPPQPMGGYPPSHTDYPPQPMGGYPPSDPMYPNQSPGGGYYPGASDDPSAANVPYPQQPFGVYPSAASGGVPSFPAGGDEIQTGYPGENAGSKLAEDTFNRFMPTAPPDDHGQDSTPKSFGFPKMPKAFRQTRGVANIKQFKNQNYEDLKRDCQRSGKLFEDPEFPASHSLLVDDNSQYIVSYFGRSKFDNSIQWSRPQEICNQLGVPQGPKMFVGELDRFDINQGEIGNCWFLAAMANLAESESCFNQVVPPNQTFGPDYCGIFRFRFWRFGEWMEVVIDDRLPTRNGELIYLRSVDKNEFWSSLLEKAYAKLHGSYKALEGGLTIEAAVDFTGGIPEMINLQETKMEPERLFYIMSKADARGAFMGCALNRQNASEAQRKGLQARHAYTLTKVVEIRSSQIRAGIPLVRLRNPHGNSKEWRGDWSDDDRNWKAIPTDLRKNLGLTFEDDGEFYMSFRDFLKYFGELELCHLTPDALDVEDGLRKFDVFHFFGEWKSGFSAGGCGNDGMNSFAQNPQFFINLSDPDPFDDEIRCPVIVSLCQKQQKRKSEHAIGFKVYKCDLETKTLSEVYLRQHNSMDRTDTFINLREISKRMVLPAGRYCIIPCTFKRGDQGDFLIRIFIERRWGTSEHGKGQAVTAAMDNHDRVVPSDVGGFNEDMSNLNIGGDSGPSAPSGSKSNLKKTKRDKIVGFAFKKLEQNFPQHAKGLKALKNFYNWATDSESEFDLLKTIQNYEELHKNCKSRKKLFRDPLFKARKELLVDNDLDFIVSYSGKSEYDASIQWLRPRQICAKLGLKEGPRMFVGEFDRFDINQGEIGNCWFLAAMANLAESKDIFRLVVPPGQDFGEAYSGIFRFRFWIFGQWIEAVIDDRLPTRNGELIYLQSGVKNEFWSALLEKAYAKLHGSYRALERGLTSDAAVDFTGGIPERIELRNLALQPEELFYIMTKADLRGAFMGCCLKPEMDGEYGLMAGHAYTLNKVVEIKSPMIPGGIPLVRIRNPHGNHNEWTGDWSDDDRNWKAIPESIKDELSLNSRGDGEFYMSFRDFLHYFECLEICHLTPGGLDEVHTETSRAFEMFQYAGKWKKDVTAGGSLVSSLAMNPQYFITLSNPNPLNNNFLCPVIVSLYQRQKERNKAVLSIGFKIYKCKDDVTSLEEKFIKKNKSVERSDCFSNMREISKRILLEPGRYCVIPCTYTKGMEGKFLLRIFVEELWGVSNLGDGTKLVSIESYDSCDSVDGRIPRRTMPVVGPLDPHKRKKDTKRSLAFKVLTNSVQQSLSRQESLEEFYKWESDRESEFDLLQDIVHFMTIT